jgi:predicted metal-dependent phosphoesterase TrpH
MSVDEFKRVDLHIHTPHSACYIDAIRPEAERRTTTEDIVKAALAADLQAIAITDHNGVEMVDDVRNMAAGHGLIVFPGTEISTRGGHLLAIFDVDADTQAARDLLAAVGFRAEQWGDGFQRSEVWMDEVMAEITARGGLAIPAHVDREPRGFLASDERPGDKTRIYHDGNLTALEVTDPSRSRRWLTGSDPRYSLPRPCIQSSDAHAPEEIGRRPTLIRTGRLSLASLREAFADYGNCVRFPD